MICQILVDTVSIRYCITDSVPRLKLGDLVGGTVEAVRSSEHPVATDQGPAPDMVSDSVRNCWFYGRSSRSHGP